jgi:hypothetical protein
MNKENGISKLLPDCGATKTRKSKLLGVTGD